MASDCIINLKINAEEAVKNITTLENSIKRLVTEAESAREALAGITMPNAATTDLTALSEAIQGLAASTEQGFSNVDHLLTCMVNNQAAIGEGTITYISAINEQLSRLPVGNIERASKATNQLARSTKNAASSSGSLLKFFRNIVRTLARFTVLIRVARRMIRLVSEGFEHMTEYSENYKNATNQLKNSFETFKLQLAGAFEPIMSTVLPYLAKLVDMLTVAADKMAQFLAVMSGRSTYNKAIKQMRDFAAEAQSASNSLAGFDELNVLSNNGGGDTGPWWEEAEIDSGVLNAYKQLSDYIDQMSVAFEHFGGIFADNFSEAFDFDPKPIVANIDSIRKSLMGIVNDPKFQAKTISIMDKLFGNAGTTAGNIATAGQNMAKGMTGGIAKWLDNGGTDQIKEHIINMYDQLGQASDIITAASGAAATISEAFSSENGVDFAANLSSVVYSELTGVQDAVTQLGLDIVDALTSPFIENAGGFETALEGFLGNGAEILEGVKSAFASVGETWDTTYNEKLLPVIHNFSSVLSNITQAITNVWNTAAGPVMDKISKKLKELGEGEAATFFNDLLGFLAEVGQTLLHVMGYVGMVVGYIIEEVVPPLSRVLGGLFDFIIDTVGNVMTFLGGFLTWFKSFFEIINAIFTGDMDKLKEAFKDWITGGWKMFAGLINEIIDAFGTLVEGIVGIINNMIRGANNIPGVDIPLIPNDFTDSWGIPTNPPFLANGGITTGSTLAMIGEAGQEAVLPLERDTGWAEVVADKLAERMGGGSYTFVAELDGKTLFSETVKQNKIYQKSTGRSAFGY